MEAVFVSLTKGDCNVLELFLYEPLLWCRDQ